MLLQNKAGRLHPPHLQHGEEVKNGIHGVPGEVGAVRCLTDALASVVLFYVPENRVQLF